MKYVFLILFAMAGLCQIFAQQLELRGQTLMPGYDAMSSLSIGTTDLWGYVAPDGEEYLLVGVREGVSVIRARDMELLLTVEGPQLGNPVYHRDIKTYRNYAYVTSELFGFREGVMVLDLSGLPDTVVYVKSFTTREVTNHNISIDTLNFRAYITGSTFEGVYIYDLLDPANPFPAGYLSQNSVHDVFARNDTMWVANGEDYSVWGMSDPSDPQLLDFVKEDTFGYCHNIWPTQDGKHFITTEETPDKTIKIWETGGVSGPEVVSEFLGKNKVGHNVHIEGDLAFIANYTGGFMIMDVSDPANPILIEEYDNYSFNDDPEFDGCWGIYPHSPYGYIYTSNQEGIVMKFALSGFTSVEKEAKQLDAKLSLEISNQLSLRFQTKATGKLNLRWLDIKGREVGKVSQTYAPGNQRISVNTEGWTPGTYFYYIETEEGMASGKWVNIR
ncbi:MAG: LVIVD repeat-containing protein [Bacteroidia bacterium]